MTLKHNQKIFLAILFIFALVGFGNLLITNPLQVLLLIAITTILLFAIKKFALDPIRNPNPHRNRYVQKKNLPKSNLRKKYPFKVIEGNKGKKQKI